MVLKTGSVNETKNVDGLETIQGVLNIGSMWGCEANARNTHSTIASGPMVSWKERPNFKEHLY